MNTQLPTLRQLRFLVTLADEGNFSRAAEACHVTQPTLSAAIKELEATLGVTLVERGARGTTLTPAGEAAVARAWNTLAEAEDLVQAARAAGEPLSGPFRLGVIPTIAPFLLPRLLPVVSKAHSRLQLYLREDLTERLLDGLRARNLDAALIALPYDAPGIESVAVGADEFLFAAAPDHPLAKRDRITASDLNDEKLLMLEDGHCLRDHALAVCSAASSRSDFAATSLHTLAQMVKSGLGATLLPRLAVEGGVTDGLELVVRPFTPAVIGREIGMAWRKGSAREAEARLIAESLKGLV
ncbi:hydrogen peroxide-inducible genes activator [Hyphobacterium sp.]|jgi:LysR family hydrogen peroxide-inducible transcriptional activator|uniref:hydrogen peroxide-inducible genes activator n=1 Tax=Hyphobacterium sp. TaxID=2004662 RepID=UPI003BAAD1DB